MFFLYGNIILLQCLSFTISAVAFHFLMYHVKNMILLQMVHGRFFTWIIYISTWTIREQQNKTVCFDKRSHLTNSFKQSELVKHISGTTIYRKHLSYKVKDHQGILVICMNKILSCESNPLIHYDNVSPVLNKIWQWELLSALKDNLDIQERRQLLQLHSLFQTKSVRCHDAKKKVKYCIVG